MAEVASSSKVAEAPFQEVLAGLHFVIPRDVCLHLELLESVSVGTRVAIAAVAFVHESFTELRFLLLGISFLEISSLLMTSELFLRSFDLVSPIILVIFRFLELGCIVREKFFILILIKRVAPFGRNVTGMLSLALFGRAI